MRIAIIDDDADERKTLQASFERLAQESGSAIVIIEFAGADDFLDGYDRSFDLICMDIDMPGTDGMSAAQRLRQMDADVPLVFVTNMAQMAIHAMPYMRWFSYSNPSTTTPSPSKCAVFWH